MEPSGATPTPGGAGPDSGPAAGRRVRVLLPLPLGEAFDYRAPDGLEVVPGAVVLVPLGRREVAGVVWAVVEDGAEEAGGVPDARLRDIVRVFDLPPLPQAARDFIDWVARYVMSPPGAVLRMTLSVPSALDPPAPVLGFRPADGVTADGTPGDVKLTPARRKVLEVLAAGRALPMADLARAAGCSPAVIRGMAERGLLRTVPLAPPAPFRIPDPDRPGHALTPDQTAAAAGMAETVAAGGYHALLLDGVTGSGKTEVYFEAVAAALRTGRQVLVLLPEIALTAQWLDRFAARFGTAPAEWHSELTGLQRRQVWRAVANGEARVVVGARSALFLPYADLGLIVVDEEHDAAYKQEDGVIYHARDMAVVRATLGELAVVLVSATPSLESVVNAEAGRYRTLHLPDRPGGAVLPEIYTIDMRAERLPATRFLSTDLREALSETLEAGDQALLFLNRRGYAPLTLCRACGHRLECPNCTAWLVDHRLGRRLMCHHCGFQAMLPPICPKCLAENSFAPCGPGVERIAEEVDAVLPEARWIVVASDTLAGPRAASDLVDQVNGGAVDLLIGTQILAKGHHFPRLTLVGVVDGDLGLGGGDLRAAERTFQLLHQVAGRAGRADRPGRVLIQTYLPEHPVIAALVAGDRDGFLEREADARRARALPPFGRLAALIVSGPDRAEVERTAQELGRKAPSAPDVQVLGPAEPPLAVLRGRHRRRLLLKASRRAPVQSMIAHWLARVDVPNAVRVAVDIDPYSFL